MCVVLEPRDGDNGSDLSFVVLSPLKRCCRGFRFCIAAKEEVTSCSGDLLSTLGMFWVPAGAVEGRLEQRSIIICPC